MVKNLLKSVKVNSHKVVAVALTIISVTSIALSGYAVSRVNRVPDFIPNKKSCEHNKDCRKMRPEHHKGCEGRRHMEEDRRELSKNEIENRGLDKKSNVKKGIKHFNEKEDRPKCKLKSDIKQ